MNGIKLKEKTVRGRAGALVLGAEALGRRLAASRLGKRLLEAAVYAAGGLVLAALPLPGGPAPAAACGVLWAGCGLRGGAALLGACGGYLLFWGWAGALEPLALSLSAFAGAVIFRRTPVSRAALGAALNAAVGGLFLLDAGLSFLPLLRLALGTGLAALTPGLLDRAAAGKPAEVLGSAPGQPPALPAQKAVEKALRTMYEVLAREDPLVRPVQLAELYDFAAEQVCGCCDRHARCWEQEAEETYRDLCAAGEAVLQRGAAEREDFPPRFRARCCHTAGFVTAVNQALDGLLTRRREDHRRSEVRRVAAGQYLTLARLLEALSRPRPREPLRYAPELAVGSAARGGNEVSGDRGAACRDPFGGFCVLLCDGMGAGPAARAESDRAARLLTAFLEAGLEPDTALELVNGFFLLRKRTAFSTLDLLRLDLRTGSGVLYKWGAAPSWLRRGEGVEKIGTATPPPGLETAEGRVPGQYELSLREGETLVMVSDGAWGEETERRLEAFVQGTVRDLASCLIALADPDPEDDRTVVVVRLRPLSSNV